MTCNYYSYILVVIYDYCFYCVYNRAMRTLLHCEDFTWSIIKHLISLVSHKQFILIVTGFAKTRHNAGGKNIIMEFLIIFVKFCE